ncbi:MAG: hypothetical protein WCL00_15390, partial [Bacteroidota bacterium]
EKNNFLERILLTGSKNAKILKSADRISNLTDLHADIFEKEYIKKYILETKKWVIPMAAQVNESMLFELNDLIKRREYTLDIPLHFWPMTRKK